MLIESLPKEIHALRINTLKQRLEDFKDYRLVTDNGVLYCKYKNHRYCIDDISNSKSKAKEHFDMAHYRNKIESDLNIYLTAWYSTYNCPVPELMPHEITRCLTSGICLNREFFESCKDQANEFRPENKIYTYKNTRFRSKSECEIARMYTDMGFKFKYETELVIDGKSNFPDFLIYSYETSGCFYHEHLGLLNNPNYQRDAEIKKANYRRAGLIEGLDIIYTFEKDGFVFVPDTLPLEVNSLIMKRLLCCQNQLVR